MNDIEYLQQQILELSKDQVGLSESEKLIFSELVSKDLKKMSWLRLLSLRGGKSRVYGSLLDALIQMKRTVGFDPITFLIMLKLIIQILILLRREFGEGDDII